MRSVIIAALVVAALASPAALAHITATPNRGPADSYFRTAFRIGHGCDGAPTIAVRVKLPDGVTSVRPQAKAGWTIDIKMKKLDKPVDAGHGRMITETVDEIAWRGVLPDAWFDEFGLSLKLPDAPGVVLYFPIVQECEKGVHRWIEIPRAGQSWDDLKQPAPYVTLTPKGSH